MRYERVRSDLQRVERVVIMTSRSNMDSEIEERVLEEPLNPVWEVVKRYRLAQAESVQKTFSQGVGME